MAVRGAPVALRCWMIDATLVEKDDMDLGFAGANRVHVRRQHPVTNEVEQQQDEVLSPQAPAAAKCDPKTSRRHVPTTGLARVEIGACVSGRSISKIHWGIECKSGDRISISGFLRQQTLLYE